MPTIRVLLADDHALFRAGIRALLRSISEIEVVGEASNGREALDNLAVPTLLLAGTVDTACPVAGMRAMAERIEDSEIHELEGVGHYGFAERPDEFHGHLLDFLGRRLPKEN